MKYVGGLEIQGISQSLCDTCTVWALAHEALVLKCSSGISIRLVSNFTKHNNGREHHQWQDPKA
jgi:hypothetical protein